MEGSFDRIRILGDRHGPVLHPDADVEEYGKPFAAHSSYFNCGDEVERDSETDTPVCVSGKEERE